MAVMTMSDHHKHTEFLKHCLVYDDSASRHQLHEKLTHTQRDLRIVQRAMWVLSLLIALGVAGLIYCVILLQNVPYNTRQFIVRLLYALIAGSLISLVTFACLWVLYHIRLRHRREECRQLLTRLLAARLGQSARPHATPLIPLPPSPPKS